MKHVIAPVMVLLAMLCFIDAKALCNLRGQITDERKEPLTGASVLLVRNGRQVAGTITDFDGYYQMKGLQAGSYKVILSALQSRDTLALVIRSSDKVKVLNIQLRLSSKASKEVVVKTGKPYRPPLGFKNPVLIGGVKAAETVEKSPNINVADQVALTQHIYQKRNSAISVGGGRLATGTTYVVDGAVLSSGNGSYQATPPAAPVYLNPSTETYKKDPENDFRSVKATPLSTLSVDVDRASYSNIRRFIRQGQKPPADAVRIEEMVNYFDYHYPQPEGADPIAINTELSECPWDSDLKLLRIGIQAKKVNMDKLPPSNLVFLIDVSGSMYSENKLPLVKSALKLLVNNLRSSDRVSIVVYAGSAGLVLAPTTGDHKEAIIEAMEQLQAGGSTAGGEGILLAYKTAEAHFIKGGNNRVILATDGDFNVGVSNENELEDLIVRQREKGIFLTCLGFGMGNYKDSKMELLADKGNGNYDYIDDIEEARKTLVHEFGGTLFTVAKDVKAQIEFNPAKVQGYRLVGYENRVLNTEDFKDDKKDAGDMGAGHTVTILYELIPAGVRNKYMRTGDALKYQQPEATPATGSNELATVKFRYKKPDGRVSTEMVHPIEDKTVRIERASANTRFAASVAMFGLLLKDSKFKGLASYDQVIALAEDAQGKDAEGYREEYISLVKKVRP